MDTEPQQSEPQQPRLKLHEAWYLVLARGLVEGALAVIYFIDGVQSPVDLAVFCGVVIGAGSLLELALAYRLPGHAFRSILVFTGLTGLVIGGFLVQRVFGDDVTLALLIVTTGLWVALRGFASLWLGLSIVSGTFDRAVPTAAGLAGLLVGGWAMIWYDPLTANNFVWAISLYGGLSVLVHLLVALRLRAEHQRALARAEGAS